MTIYKPHYACFKCRKTFKRRLMGDINRGEDDKADAKCPQCGELMADMGHDFEAPKMNDVAAWKHIESLFSVGIAFHSCGCTGPGYIPKDRDSLIAYFEEKLDEYRDQLAFWRERKEPADERELQREYSKNWDYIGKVPGNLRPRKAAIPNDVAKDYWMGRIKEVEQKINALK